MSADVSDKGARTFSDDDFKEAPSDALVARELQSQEFADDLAAAQDPIDPDLAKVESLLDDIIAITDTCLEFIESEDNPVAARAYRALMLESESAEKNIRKFKGKDLGTDQWLLANFTPTLDELDEKLTAICTDEDYTIGEGLADEDVPAAAAADEVLPRETILMNKADTLVRPTAKGVHKLPRGGTTRDVRAVCQDMAGLKKAMIDGVDGAHERWWDGFERLVDLLAHAQVNNANEYAAFFRAGIVDLVTGLRGMIDGGMVCNEELPNGILSKL